MELADYLRGLRRHWIAMTLITLVGVLAAFAWASIQTPVYQATAIGLVQTRAIADANEENQNLVSPAYDNLARAKVPTYIDMATWEVVATGAIDLLDLNETPGQVVSRISVSNPSSTSIIRITARGATPEAAASLASAWLTSLTDTIDQVEGDGTAGSSPITLFETSSAVLPSEPVFPDMRLSLIVGGVLGLGFGIAFAMMRTVSDRRIRLADDVEGRTDIPVVGTIPVSDSTGDTRRFSGDTSRAGSGFAVSESMRALRTNLQFMDVDNPPRTIVVTSPLPGDGKSTIACNLALTLAASGRAVVLVDGDLRRSMVAKTMGLVGGSGLSDVLSGRAQLVDVLQRVPDADNLFVLAAGSVPPNPSEVLGSERMHKLLADLASHATVIIDAPPVLPVTDGAVLTHQADGALVVVSVGKTTYDLLHKAVDTLSKAGGRALGIVLNKAPLRGADASAYSYEYRRSYGEPAGPAARGKAASTPSTESASGAALDDVLAASEAPLEEVPAQRNRRA